MFIKPVQVQRASPHRRWRPAQEAAHTDHLRIHLARRGPRELRGLAKAGLAQQDDGPMVQEIREHSLAGVAVFNRRQNLLDAARYEDGAFRW